MENTRLLKEVLDDKETLVKILENNTKLVRDIEEDIIESEMNYISDMLNYFRESLRDYSIGFYNRNYIEVKDYENLIDSCIRVTEDYGFFNEEDLEYCKYANELYERLNMMGWGNKQRDNLENKIEEVNNIIEDKVIEQFNKYTDYWTILKFEYLCDYFYEFYASERLEEDLYFNTETYELFEDISYTKSYA